MKKNKIKISASNRVVKYLGWKVQSAIRSANALKTASKKIEQLTSLFQDELRKKDFEIDRLKKENDILRNHGRIPSHLKIPQYLFKEVGVSISEILKSDIAIMLPEILPVPESLTPKEKMIRARILSQIKRFGNGRTVAHVVIRGHIAHGLGHQSEKLFEAARAHFKLTASEARKSLSEKRRRDFQTRGH